MPETASSTCRRPPTASTAIRRRRSFACARIREHELRFDPRIRPNFEDGHFNCCYLLEHARPQVGFLGTARYHYRLRADGTSTLQTSAPHPGRYTAVPEFGYLDLVHRAIERYGEVPGWLASCLLYDMHWYFTAPDPEAPAGRPEAGDLVEHFHALAAEILGRLDVSAALPFVPPTVPPLPRLVMEHGYRDEPWLEGFVQLDSLDVPQELVRASYFFTGDLPEETWRADGSEVIPRHAKVRDFRYYGRVLLHERIVWLPADRSLQADLGGAPVDIVYERPHGPVKVAQPGQIRWWLNPESARNRSRVPAHLRVRSPKTKRGRLAQILMNRPSVREKYADAWVLMDRLHDAADSAEILFRYLRDHHPEINAWFVLEKGGKEWDRFLAAGHGDRLVAHDSLQWRLLMAHATHLLSSHAEAPIVAPQPILEFTNPGWRFHFLQHGVIKDDLSAWLNRKKLDTFVVSTHQEMASIAGDHTSYVFTTREVALTGLPRFDRLHAVGLRFPPERRDLLLVAPTWRNGLMPPMIAGSQRRELDLSLLETDFIRNWLAFLRDDKLAAACDDQGVKLAFLPHPNLQPLLSSMDLPRHVLPLSYEGEDPQELFARARVLVTDFSSVAFNAAYLERPVVYYQFDAESVLEGEHVGRRGYFDYTRHGFGPVAGHPGRGRRGDPACPGERALADAGVPGPDRCQLPRARRPLLAAGGRARPPDGPETVGSSTDAHPLREVIGPGPSSVIRCLDPPRGEVLIVLAAAPFHLGERRLRRGSLPAGLHRLPRGPDPRARRCRDRDGRRRLHRRLCAAARRLGSAPPRHRPGDPPGQRGPRRRPQRRHRGRARGVDLLPRP